MSSNRVRVAAGIAIVVAAAVLLVTLRDDGGNGSSAAMEGVPTIVLENGRPVGGIAQLTYNEGERVRFKVESDVDDEVHLHGYDIAREVKAGGSVRFDFPATVEGLFEAELEDHGEQILELRVNP